MDMSVSLIHFGGTKLPHSCTHVFGWGYYIKWGRSNTANHNQVWNRTVAPGVFGSSTSVPLPVWSWQPEAVISWWRRSWERGEPSSPGRLIDSDRAWARGRRVIIWGSRYQLKAETSVETAVTLEPVSVEEGDICRTGRSSCFQADRGINELLTSETRLQYKERKTEQGLISKNPTYVTYIHAKVWKITLCNVNKLAVRWCLASAVNVNKQLFKLAEVSRLRVNC